MKEKYIHEWFYKRSSSKQTKSLSFLLPNDFPTEKLTKGVYIIKLYKLEKEVKE